MYNLTSNAILNLLSAWYLTYEKRLPRGYMQEDSFIVNTSKPNVFDQEIKFVGQYVRTSKAKWLGSDVFTLASLQIYVNNKVILDADHPKLDAPVYLESDLQPIPDHLVKDHTKSLASIFKLFGVKLKGENE